MRGQRLVSAQGRDDCLVPGGGRREFAIARGILQLVQSSEPDQVVGDLASPEVGTSTRTKAAQEH
jgi:hypothetical protein